MLPSDATLLKSDKTGLLAPLAQDLIAPTQAPPSISLDSNQQIDQFYDHLRSYGPSLDSHNPQKAFP